MRPETQRAIFAIQSFANAYSDQHVACFKMFQSVVPAHQRMGFYGKEQRAYVEYLKKIQHPNFLKLIQHDIFGQTLDS